MNNRELELGLINITSPKALGRKSWACPGFDKCFPGLEAKAWFVRGEFQLILCPSQANSHIEEIIQPVPSTDAHFKF